MQLLAMLTMLVDHIGIVFFPDQDIWRMIGRLAFPLYAYLLVCGYDRTSNVFKYMIRLALIALVAQIPYYIALGFEQINVVGTFLCCLIVLYLLDKSYWFWSIVPFVLLMLEALHFEYGYYALLLVLIYRYLPYRYMIPTHLIITLVYAIYIDWWISIIAVIVTVLIVYGATIWDKIERINIPLIVWRAFYPAHLLILAVLAVWRGGT